MIAFGSRSWSTPAQGSPRSLVALRGHPHGHREPRLRGEGSGDGPAPVVARVGADDHLPATPAARRGDGVTDEPVRAVPGYSVSCAANLPRRSPARSRDEGGQLSVEALDVAVAVRDALLWYPWVCRIVSSTSTNAIPFGSVAPASTGGTTVSSPAIVRAATASSFRTCPNVNERRNVPSVERASPR